MIPVSIKSPPVPNRRAETPTRYSHLPEVVLDNGGYVSPTHTTSHSPLIGAGEGARRVTIQGSRPTQQGEYTDIVPPRRVVTIQGDRPSTGPYTPLTRKIQDDIWAPQSAYQDIGPPRSVQGDTWTSQSTYQDIGAPPPRRDTIQGDRPSQTAAYVHASDADTPRRGTIQGDRPSRYPTQQPSANNREYIRYNVAAAEEQLSPYTDLTTRQVAADGYAKYNASVHKQQTTYTDLRTGQNRLLPAPPGSGGRSTGATRRLATSSTGSLGSINECDNEGIENGPYRRPGLCRTASDASYTVPEKYEEIPDISSPVFVTGGQGTSPYRRHQQSTHRIPSGPIPEYLELEEYSEDGKLLSGPTGFVEKPIPDYLELEEWIEGSLTPAGDKCSKADVSVNQGDAKFESQSSGDIPGPCYMTLEKPSHTPHLGTTDTNISSETVHIPESLLPVTTPGYMVPRSNGGDHCAKTISPAPEQQPSGQTNNEQTSMYFTLEKPCGGTDNRQTSVADDKDAVTTQGCQIPEQGSDGHTRRTTSVSDMPVSNTKASGNVAPRSSATLPANMVGEPSHYMELQRD